MREIRGRQQTTEIEVRISECTDVAYCFLDSLSTRGVGSNELPIPRSCRFEGVQPGYSVRKIRTAETPAKSCDTTIDQLKLKANSIYCITLRAGLYSSYTNYQYQYLSSSTTTTTTTTTALTKEHNNPSQGVGGHATKYPRGG
jgi:hypothetical protein